MPTLLTASAGNHGLAVAAAARFAGAKAKVFLYPGVSVQREKRIADQGAEIVRVDGTYDDAVAATKRAAASGEGILVADTSSDINDVGVADVMAGYGILAHEIKSQVADDVSMHPTHVFVQAGVGGLAAAIATGLADWQMENSTTFIVVEPQTAACLAAAIEARQPVRISGDLDTVATMLACGEASAPALHVLQDRAKAISASEQLLQQAPQVLAEFGGPVSTPSGAAGLAGLLAASRDPEWRAKLNLNSSSKALLLITEGAINS
jgi:diaminopropionate ammonia-lyase